jgi:general secretion pathway protein B
MSLILDALQQAEQERRQGAAPPDLFTPPPPPSTPAAPAPATKRPLVWLLVALVLGAGAAGWWTARQTGQPIADVPAASPPAMAATRAPAPRTPPPDKALFTEPAPPATPAAVTAVTPPAKPARTVAAALPDAPARATPAQAPSGADLPALGDLPAQTRAGLPSLVVSGHTYSDNPTLRSLMIDGRMFVEGQALAPGLRLERIGPHRAVFNLRGMRFGVDY